MSPPPRSTSLSPVLRHLGRSAPSSLCGPSPFAGAGFEVHQVDLTGHFLNPRPSGDVRRLLDLVGALSNRRATARATTRKPQRQRNPRLAQQQIQEIVAGYHEGLPVRELAERVGSDGRRCWSM